MKSVSEERAMAAYIVVQRPAKALRQACASTEMILIEGTKTGAA